jgi:FkbM family methyltransferase
MKTAIKNFLLHKNLYYPLKYSRLFHLYQLIFKPTEIRLKKKEIGFYKSFLPPCDLIFDIGAYDGHKTEAFLNLAAKVVCCEPDKENFKILQSRFRNKNKRVMLENKALSDKEGIAEFHIHQPGSAFNTLSPKWKKLLEEDNMEKWDEQITFTQKQTVATTTLDHLISQYGLPGFIKLDVEGFEETVLKGLSHRVPWLSFETIIPDYHAELLNSLAIIGALDTSPLYNIALAEELVLPEFVTKDELINWLNEHTNVRSFEVIVKMNYESSHI